MIVIDNIIKDLNSIKEMSSDKVNCCHKIFEDIIDGAKIDEDIYHSAKAFTSIINNIINKKLNYINYIVDNQIELLTFLNTYDDKYLSNIENLLIEKTGNEVLIANDLAEDIFDLVMFLEDFLGTINNLKKNNLPIHLQQELNKILEDIERKYNGGLLWKIKEICFYLW